MTNYPEHEKMAQVAADSQRLGEFIDWLGEHGYRISELHRVGKYDDGRWAPVHKPVNEWLALFYDIDLEKIETEKRQMLAYADPRTEHGRAEND